MNRLLLYLICSFTSCVICLAQNSNKYNSVLVVNSKVLFSKTIIPSKRLADDDLYQKLKEWATNNYGKDPFVSSVRYDSKTKNIIAKSRIELALPVKKGVNEKMIMRYRINGIIKDGKYIFEITEITYMYENSEENLLPKVIRSEDFITDAALNKNDGLSTLRLNTRNRTLQYINQMSESLDVVFR